MKKLLSIITVMSITAAFAVPAMAADKEKGEPDVFVDGSQILFNDQNAVIVDDITLVPARGVFEAMGNTVEWNDKDRTVLVTSSTGVREVLLTIDSDVMKVTTYRSLFERTEEEKTLEVSAKIMNDRTMIPLRAVSEAFDCEVEWDGDAYSVSIATGDPILLEGYTYNKPAEDKLTKLSITSDTDTVSTGDEFEVYIDAANLPADSFVSGIVATFEYDKEKFSYIEGSGTFVNNSDEPTAATISVENTEYSIGTKLVLITIDEASARDTNGHIFKAVFKKLTDEGGTIELSNRYDLELQYETYLQVTKKGDQKDTIYDGRNLLVDTTPITIY